MCLCLCCEDGEEAVISKDHRWERMGKADMVKKTTSVAKLICKGNLIENKDFFFI